MIGIEPPGYYGSTLHWALVLDYVPVVWWREDYKLRWPSGGREEVLSFVWRPLDYEWEHRDARWAIRRDAGRERVGSDAAKVLGQLQARAIPTFERIRSIDDLPALFELKRTRVRAATGNHVAGGLWPHDQLAYAFTLARLGCADEGRPLLEQFISRDHLMPRSVRRDLRAIYEGVGLSTLK